MSTKSRDTGLQRHKHIHTTHAQCSTTLPLAQNIIMLLCVNISQPLQHGIVYMFMWSAHAALISVFNSSKQRTQT